VSQLTIPNFQFDEDLREVPECRQEWEFFLNALKSELNREADSAKQLTLLGYAGSAARILLRLDEAELYLSKALALSRKAPTSIPSIQNLIRLAHVYQWKGEFEKAHELFGEAKTLIEETEVSESLRATFHQHLGKYYFDQGYYGRAQAEFATALSLRDKIEVPNDQRESSRVALNEALKRWGRSFTDLLIRRAVPSDAEAIHRAHMTSIQEVCAKDYSPEEIRAWGHRPFDEKKRLSAIKSDLVLVVEKSGSIEGYGHIRVLEKEGVRLAHLFGLYLTPNIIGQNLGHALVDVMIEEAKAQKVKAVSLESTITAREFYRKMGFSEVGPETTVQVNGVPIRCYQMTMPLH